MRQVQGAGVMKQTTPMQRTAFARKVPMARISKKSPDRTEKIARINHLRKERSIFRSPAYLAAVRSIPCVCCGTVGLTQAAHSNQLAFGKGRGLKASDASAMALCGPGPGRTGCHAGHDQGGGLSKSEWKAFEHQNIVATVMALIKFGRLIDGAGEITTRTPQGGNYDFELMAVFLVGLIERGELCVTV